MQWFSDPNFLHLHIKVKCYMHLSLYYMPYHVQHPHTVYYYIYFFCCSFYFKVPYLPGYNLTFYDSNVKQHKGVNLKSRFCALKAYTLPLPLKFSPLLYNCCHQEEKINTTSCCGHLNTECCCEAGASVHTDKKFKFWNWGWKIGGGGGGGGGRLITGKIQHHLYSTDVCVHTETYFICLLLLV